MSIHEYDGDGMGPEDPPMWGRRVTRRVASRRQVIEHQLRQLQAEAAQLDQYPDTDPHTDHTILHIRRTLHDTSGPKAYNYAVIRANSRWYATGDVHRLSRVGWPRLVDWIIEGAGEIVAEYPPDGRTYTEQEADRNAEMANFHGQTAPEQLDSDDGPF